MNTIEIEGKKRLHPQSWDEMSRRQFVALTPILLKENIVIADRNRIANYLLNNWKDLYFNFPEELLLLHEFLFTDGDCSKWFMDIRYGVKIWKGFGDKLAGVTFERWIYADSYFMRYEQSKDYDELLKFMAAVYLPHSDMASILRKYKIFRHVSEKDTRSIVFNFRLVKRWMTLQFPYLFPEKTVKTKPNFKKNTPWTAWADIYDGLVGDDLINEESYSNLPAMTVFRKLNKKLKDV